jgi:glycosyltransferase involved in cell wall biosynthesis
VKSLPLSATFKPDSTTGSPTVILFVTMDGVYMVEISLGLPVFNGEDYLRDCIDSILAQTFTDFELIISDNGSTDSSLEICRQYETRDPRIRVLAQDSNIGAANNFNLVFRSSGGKYFKWCAHDDLIEPAFLEKTRDRLEQNRAAVLCHSYTEVFGGEASENQVFEPGFRMDRNSSAERLRQMILHGQKCYEVFGLIRRDALENTGLIGNHKGGDNVLLYRLALLGVFLVVPRPLFRLRRHAKQSTELVKDSQAYQQWFTGRTHKTGFPDWYMLREMWKTPTGIGLSLAERLRCYRALALDTWLRRRRLQQNLRVSVECLVFGSSDPQRRRRLADFAKTPGTERADNMSANFVANPPALSVSVVIPTYNRRLLVGRAIESVLAQTRPADEIIVVDDGSTDDTFAWLNTQYGDRITCIRQSNQGVAVARNTGLKTATCTFVGFLDSDDIWLPEKLALQIPVLSDPSISLAATNWCWEGAPEDDQFSALGFLSPKPMEIDREPLLRLCDRQDHGLIVPSCIFRRDLIEKLGGFDTSLRISEDMDLLYRLADEGAFAVFSCVLYVRGTDDLNGNLTNPGSLGWRCENLENVIGILSRRKAANTRRSASSRFALRRRLTQLLSYRAKLHARASEYSETRGLCRAGLSNMVLSKDSLVCLLGFVNPRVLKMLMS